MNSLTIKIPEGLDAALAEASVRAQLSKSELVRRAVTPYLVPGREGAGTAKPPSALALAGDLVGCVAGGPADLASNPRHLDDFGRRSAIPRPCCSIQGPGWPCIAATTLSMPGRASNLPRSTAPS